MELYIVRHGETVWNKQWRLQGSTDIKLSENGIDMAKKTGYGMKNIDFKVAYSSPLSRAYDTAKIIVGDRNIDIIKDNRIREISFGDYEGKTYDELENMGTDFKYFFDRPEIFKADKNGESLKSIIYRAGLFLEDIIKKYGETDSKILIVAHGAINKAIMANIKKSEIKDFWSGGLQKNCNTIIVAYKNGQFNILNEGKIFY